MSQVIKYPKTLILCQNKINQYTGGGIVLSNLFGSADADRLMFFHRDINYDHESQYDEHKLIWKWLRPRFIILVELFFRWVCAGLFRFKRIRMSDIRKIVLQSCYFKIPSDLERQVRDFKPDIIYAWGGDILWVSTISKMAKWLNLPCVIHFMDNHVGVVPKSAIELALLPVFQRELSNTIATTNTIYTISDSMGRAYKKIWHKPYEVFHGVIDATQWPFPESSKKNKPFTIAFTGSVEHGQLVGLIDVAKTLEMMIEKGIEIRLVLYLTEKYMDIARPVLGGYRCVEFKPHPDFSMLRNELLKNDLCILAFGFDAQTINYFRYSFSTKIVPYMMSGRAIIVYGPEEIEPVRYAIAGGWAEVINKNDKDLLALRINELINDDVKRERLAKLAWQAGGLEHDLHANSIRFSQSLYRNMLR